MSDKSNSNLSCRGEDILDKDACSMDMEVLSVADSVSGSSKPGPKSSKVKKSSVEPDDVGSSIKGGKRKDISLLLGTGKSIAPDKRRRCKVVKYPVESDRDSGSEGVSDPEFTMSSGSTSGCKEGRAARLVKRAAVIETEEQRSRKREECRPASPVLSDLDLNSLKRLGIEWLDDIDAARKSSKNLKGGVHKAISTGVLRSKRLIEALVFRLEDKGDVRMRSQVVELTAQLRALKCEKENMAQELDMLRKEIDILRNKISGGALVSDSAATRGGELNVSSRNLCLETGGDVLGEPCNLGALAPKETLDGAVTCTPLPQRSTKATDGIGRLRSEAEEPKGKSSEIHAALANLDASSIGNIDEASIDELIHILVDVRNLRKPDLPPLINPFRDNLTAVLPPDPSIPPKKGRGRPRKNLVRKEQLVLPRVPLVEGVASTSGMDEVSTLQTMVTATSMDWAPVVRRKRNRRKKNNNDMLRPRVTVAPSVGEARSSAPPRVLPVPGRRRPPRSAAVTITVSAENSSYAAVLKKARENIPLAEMGIENSRIRRTVNGGRIIEIPGLDAAEKTDKLAERLRSVLGAEAVIARPSIKGELRILGLDDTVTTEEVISVISDLGKCSISEVKVGVIRPLSSGLVVV